MEQLSIEQKMEYLRKALEMGARFDIYFHGIENKEAAEKIANELKTVVDFQFEDGKADINNYIATDYGQISTSIFFQNYMEEDVQLDGGDDHAA
ncbi:MAG: hypothetical protein Q8935_18620 [Bacillota bacterium]|nr:hypothetical protein [Bacillota bacterium]